MPISDDETQALSRTGGHQDSSARAMAEVLRLVRELNGKIDRQDRELTDIKLRLERGASSIEMGERNGEILAALKDKFIVLDTRFAIVWAGISIAGAAGIGGIVMGAIAFMKSMGPS